MAYRKKQYKDKTLVFVEWQDASSSASWNTAARELEDSPFLVHNIGWTIGWDKGNCLVVTSQIDLTNDKPGMVTHIPLGMIKRVKVLKDVS